jgi:Fe-S-cluster containining protein
MPRVKRCEATSVEKAVLKTLEGKETTVTEQTPIPCFRCGICCTRYQPPLGPKDIGSIASALGISRSECISRYAAKVPTKEGYLLKQAEGGCVFLAWDVDGRARCSIYSARPKACREWAPSLAKPACLEGLAKLKSEGQILALRELFLSREEQKELYHALETVSQHLLK